MSSGPKNKKLCIIMVISARHLTYVTCVGDMTEVNDHYLAVHTYAYLQSVRLSFNFLENESGIMVGTSSNALSFMCGLSFVSDVFILHTSLAKVYFVQAGPNRENKFP